MGLNQTALLRPSAHGSHLQLEIRQVNLNRMTAAVSYITNVRTYRETGPKLYILGWPSTHLKPMAARLYTATIFALYQLTLLAGIVLLPVAMVTRRFGVRLPIERAVDGLNDAYEQARE